MKKTVEQPTTNKTFEFMKYYCNCCYSKGISNAQCEVCLLGSHTVHPSDYSSDNDEELLKKIQRQRSAIVEDHKKVSFSIDIMNENTNRNVIQDLDNSQSDGEQNKKESYANILKKGILPFTKEEDISLNNVHLTKFKN